MHDDEIMIDATLVARLIGEQFPQWSGHALEAVPLSGTDNAMWRLGNDMAVRLPLRQGAGDQIAKEQRFLPQLAPYLPLPVPVPLGLGKSSGDYPFAWSVCRWLPGENGLRAPIGDLTRAARDLAAFIGALQRIDAAGGPAPGSHNSFRGEPLVHRDRAVRAALASLEGLIDIEAAAAAWRDALDAPAWTGPPRWIHGDLHPGNLLTEAGRLSGVIDFGCLGVGDPACELLSAWTVLDHSSRIVLRDRLDVDAASWRRGRGWALSMGLIALPYYLDSNPMLVAIARRAISETLGDVI